MIEDVFEIECDSCEAIYTSNEPAYNKDEQMDNICPSCYF